MDVKLLVETPPWEWPEEAGEIIRTKIADRGSPVSERLAAVECAGENVVHNAEMTKTLLALVASKEEPEALRARAAISLGPVLEAAEIDEFDPEEAPIDEALFTEVQEALRRIHYDESEPKEVRRRVLEASVRAAQAWHAGAVRDAYASKDEEWKLTAVFGMRYVAGFHEQILESLNSRNEEIRYEAVHAAGERELAAAWPHIEKLLTAKKTQKDLLLAAIEAAAFVNPDEAMPLLADFSESDDEDIAEAASEAMSMGAIVSNDLDEEEDDEDA
jgi:hypothetical protein